MSGGDTIRLYIPVTILLQYVEANSIDELKTLTAEHKVAVLRDLLRATDNDIHTTIYLPKHLKNKYKALRRELYGKILGKDVIPYFRKEDPFELEPQEEYELILSMDAKLLERMKLRKFKVIDRFLWTHMVLKAYINLNNMFGSKIKEFWKYDNMIDTTYASYRAVSVEKGLLTHLVIHPYNFCEQVNIFYPEQLSGIMSKLPLLKQNTIFQYALMYCLVYDDLGNVLELSDTFISDTKAKIKDFHEEYERVLDKAIERFKSIIDGTDTPVTYIRQKLMEGSIPLLKLPEIAEISGFTYEELLMALEVLRKRGEVIFDDEKMCFKLNL